MGVFSLAGWSRRIRAGLLVSRVTQDTATPLLASRKGLSPAMAGLSRPFRSQSVCDSAVLQPRGCIATVSVWALPRSLATTGGITFCFLFLEVLRCFSSLRSPHYNCVMMTVLQTDGLSHSEIRGSRDICSYPRLIAAYHVLHRLHEPRHPPCALIHFLGRCRRNNGGISYFQLCPAKSGNTSFLSFTLQFRVSICQRSLFLLLKETVENNGFEPLTPCLQSRCSSQLS